jgi:AcrR family transcriptional regulator
MIPQWMDILQAEHHPCLIHFYSKLLTEFFEHFWKFRSMPAKSSSNRPSRADRRTERQQAIIEAAAKLFAQLGYSGCEMERVSSELGIAKGTLYLYFPGKQDLFFACVDLGMGQMQDAIREATATVKDPFEMIARAIRAYLNFFDENPHYVELIIQERANFKDRKRPTYFEHRDANRGPWRQLYTDLVAEGKLRNDVPVEQMLNSVGNMIYGTMFTNLFIGRNISLDEQYNAIYEIALRGITRQPAN